jgi:hypothetical protein
MNKSEFLSLPKRRAGIDYSFLVIGRVVIVPLNGRTALRAQRSLLQTAKRKGWIVTTRITDGTLYALREA